jgi:rod shape-determining protein MreD
MTLNELQALAITAGRRLLPIGLSVLIALLSLTPLEFSGLIVATGPMVALSILVFWILVRADDLPAGSMFLCGLVFDATGGGPLGLWALGFLLAYLATRLRRDEGRGTSKLVSIVTYAVAGTLCCATVWLAASLYVGGLVDPSHLVAGTLISMGMFVILLALFGSRLAMPTRYMDRI